MGRGVGDAMNLKPVDGILRVWLSFLATLEDVQEFHCVPHTLALPPVSILAGGAIA